MHSILFLFFLIYGGPVLAEENWVRLFNRAENITDFEHAAEVLEQDFLSITAEAISPLVPSAPRVHPTELEREFVSFYIAKLYLDRYQKEPTEESQAGFQISVRRLARYGTRRLHLMSKLMIARAREYTYGNYDIRYDFEISIPIGASKWNFWSGGGDPHRSVRLNDFRQEYREDVAPRSPNILSAWCVFFLAIPCFKTVTFLEDRELDLLRSFPIWLEVLDAEGRTIPVPELQKIADQFRENRH